MLMTLLLPTRGANFIDRIFTGSFMASEGLPVRRALSTLRINASLGDVYAAAQARDRRVIQFAGYWFFADAKYQCGEVIGLSEQERPILGFCTRQ